MPASEVPLASHSLIKVAPKLSLHSGVLKRVRCSILSHGPSITAVPQTVPLHTAIPPTMFNDPATCFDYCLVGWLDWCEMTIARFIVVLNADTFPYWWYKVESRRWRGRRKTLIPPRKKHDEWLASYKLWSICTHRVVLCQWVVENVFFSEF